MPVPGIAVTDGRTLKVFCSALCLIVLASNFWTMRSWTERTGVYDDICYLRQAHLFQRFGLGGINTDIARDDDRFFATLAREIGYAGWADPALAFCHTTVGDKRVIQYPPGTGFALSIFPEGFQRVPLYLVANLVVFLAALLAIWSARSTRSVAASGIVGIAALYFMINPAKASFSIAPTMIVCAVVGYLTNALAYSPDRSRRITAAVFAGLLLGLAVSFRLPNLFLSAGYFVVLLGLAVHSRGADVTRFVVFGAAYLLGLAPTLLANAINAGSALATTYSSSDAVPPDFSFSIVGDYMRDTQGSLIILTAAWAAFAVFLRAQKVAASIVAVNLVTNSAFFFSHPIFTPYYLMPLAMLSLWTLLATTVKQSTGSIPARVSPSVALSSTAS
jgi:hypothetical protein